MMASHTGCDRMYFMLKLYSEFWCYVKLLSWLSRDSQVILLRVCESAGQGFDLCRVVSRRALWLWEEDCGSIILKEMKKEALLK